MTTGQGIAVLAAVFVVLVAAMAFGWRRRVRRSADVVGPPPELPAGTELGAALCPPVAATYVSTTTAGDWLDRVAAHDLGVRSAATVQVHDGGVVIARTGARDVFVPAAAVRDVHLAPGIAGKFVGRDGLVVIRWAAAAAGVELDTGLHVRHTADRQVLTAAVGRLAPTTTLDSAPEKEHQ